MLQIGGGTANFRYWRILLIVIESGMVYSIALIIEITLYFIGSNAFYIVYDPIAQLTVRPLSPSITCLKKLVANRLCFRELYRR